jgi:hypothetical protein
MSARLSAVERKPAQLVAQPLVVEHKFSDLVGELGALPLALQAASRLALVFSRCRPRRPDRVGRSTKLVGRHMAHSRGLAGGVRGMPCCPTQVSGRGVCMAGRHAGLAPGDLTPRPGTPEVDRPTWTVVLRPCLLEVVQHMLRAVSRPDRQKAMIVVVKAAAAAHGDEPRIPDLGEDHQLPISLLCVTSRAKIAIGRVVSTDFSGARPSIRRALIRSGLPFKVSSIGSEKRNACRASQIGALSGQDGVSRNIDWIARHEALAKLGGSPRHDLSRVDAHPHS